MLATLTRALWEALLLGAGGRRAAHQSSSSMMVGFPSSSVALKLSVTCKFSSFLNKMIC